MTQNGRLPWRAVKKLIHAQEIGLVSSQRGPFLIYDRTHCLITILCREPKAPATKVIIIIIFIRPIIIIVIIIMTSDVVLASRRWSLWFDRPRAVVHKTDSLSPYDCLSSSQWSNAINRISFPQLCGRQRRSQSANMAILNSQMRLVHRWQQLVVSWADRLW